jgi:predicted DNA-binding WGR domain protein
VAVDKYEWDFAVNLFRFVVDAGISATLEAEWGRVGDDPMYEIRTFSELDHAALKKLVDIADKNERASVKIDHNGRAVIKVMPNTY